MEAKWKEFYENRINSGYQRYFEFKYHPFLNMIIRQSDKLIFEAGCGMGSVSKFLMQYDKICDGIDLCPDMAKLACINTGVSAFKQGDIFNYSTNFLTVTHGVLEHFTDEQILEIKDRYPFSIHYVPLDKYVTPSYGDERLLPYEYWLDLLKPKEYEVFNNGLDLTFKL